MSAEAHTLSKSLVLEWQMVTVASLPLPTARIAAGLPTTMLLPKTTTCLPAVSIWKWSIISITAVGVQGGKAVGSSNINLPALSGLKQSTSFSTAISYFRTSSFIWAGIGLIIKMPWIFLSWFNFLSSKMKSFWVISSGNSFTSKPIPIFSAVFLAPLT